MLRHNPSLYPEKATCGYAVRCIWNIGEVRGSHTYQLHECLLMIIVVRLPITELSALLFSKSTGSLPSARAVGGCQRARHQDKGRHMRTFRKRSFHQLLHDRMRTQKERRPIFDTKDRLLDPVDLRISCLMKQSCDRFCHFSAMVFPSMSL